MLRFKANFSRQTSPDMELIVYYAIDNNAFEFFINEQATI